MYGSNCTVLLQRTTRHLIYSIRPLNFAHAPKLLLMSRGLICHGDYVVLITILNYSVAFAALIYTEIDRRIDKT